MIDDQIVQGYLLLRGVANKIEESVHSASETNLTKSFTFGLAENSEESASIARSL